MKFRDPKTGEDFPSLRPGQSISLADLCTS